MTACAPLYATARTPGRPTVGNVAVNLGTRILGRPLDDWQRSLLLTAGELDGARLAYPTVVLIVPRRAGKTLAALLAALGVIVAGPGRRGWYTLHRREIGAALWRDEWFPLLETSRLADPRGLLTLRRSNGSESVTVRRRHSTLRLFAPSGEALRSQNADVVVVDEAREFTGAQGDTLEAAVRPAQARRTLRQLWVLSSAPGPNAPAEWLRRYRDRGRAAVDAGDRNGTLYLEYAAPPDLPYDDPTTWALGHPGIAAGHVDPAALLPDLAALDPATFAAEYLGWWAPEHDRSGGINLDAWAKLAGPTRLDDLTGWRVSVDCTRDRSAAAVAVAAPTAPGSCHVEVVAEGPGASWAVGAVLDLLARRPDARAVVDGYGPAGNLAVELATRAPGRVDTLATADAARSYATLLDLVDDGRLSHRGQPEVADALVDAAARRYGDTLLWDRHVTPPAVCALTWAAAAAARPASLVPIVASSR